MKLIYHELITEDMYKPYKKVEAYYRDGVEPYGMPALICFQAGTEDKVEKRNWHMVKNSFEEIPPSEAQVIRKAIELLDELA